MSDETLHDQPRSSKDVLWLWLWWLPVIVALYVLSIGPILLITTKTSITNVRPVEWLLTSLYTPLHWAYTKTLFHKPLGLYYHLWIPSCIDGKGNIIRK